MSRAIPFKTNTTGAGAIAASAAVPADNDLYLVSISLHLDGVPTTSELFTVTLNANAGAAYDTLLYSLDLSAGSTVDLVWTIDTPLFLVEGDSIDVAYTNTEANTYGLQITMKLEE